MNELPPERELLEILARDVMGWRCEELRWPPGAGPDFRSRRYGVQYRGPESRSGLSLYDDDSPYLHKHEGWNPLENIADAWLLVEKLRLTITPGAKAGWNGWECARCNWSQSGETTAVGLTNHRRFAWAATPTHAICLAAYQLRRPS